MVVRLPRGQVEPAWPSRWRLGYNTGGESKASADAVPALHSSSQMRVLFDLGALFAVLLLGYLFYLVLFERGALYRTNTEVHGLGDRQRLRLLGALLETPPLHIDSFRVIREGPELYDAQLEAIAAAKR